MGHIGVKWPNQVADGLPRLGDIPASCSICSRSNITRSPFPSSTQTRSNLPGERIHMDICGRLASGIGNVGYFLLLIDDFSRYSTIYALKTRDEALSYFKEFKAAVENLHNTKIKFLRCDNAPEFIHGQFGEFVRESGITFEKSSPDSPQQNGVAERHNYTFGNMIRALLADADFSDWFWPLAAQVASYIKNRVPHKALPPGKSPYELWTGVRPDLSRLRPFGAHCIARIVGGETTRSKFSPKGEAVRFVGYARNSKSFLVWDPVSRSVKTRRDLAFPAPAGPSIGHGGVVDSALLRAVWAQEPQSDEEPDVYVHIVRYYAPVR
jgi:hypothetical protein